MSGNGGELDRGELGGNFERTLEEESCRRESVDLRVWERESMSGSPFAELVECRESQRERADWGKGGVQLKSPSEDRAGSARRSAVPPASISLRSQRRGMHVIKNKTMEYCTHTQYVYKLSEPVV